MNKDNHEKRICGPTGGDPALRSMPDPNGSRPAPNGYRGRISVMPLACLSNYDYLCHDHACRNWPNCSHGGNRY